MRINNNLMAMNTHRQLGITNNMGAKSMEKLSSGFRINRAGDDAAGLAISEKMRGQIRGLNQASRNAMDGISLIQTAEGALTETHSILQRMRELAVQSANDTNVDVDRGELQKEINQLAEEITRIAETTEFNTQSLLDGTLSDIKFHIGANQDQNINLSVNDMSAQTLGVVSDITKIGQAGSGVTGVEADLGFDLTGFNLTATSGGAIAARLTGDNANVIESYAADLTASYAEGITNAGNAVFADNQFSVAAYGGFDWTNIDTAETNAVTLTASASGNTLTVAIAAEDDDGNTLAVTDILAANTAGEFVYDAHGVSFTLESIDNSGTFVIDLAALAGAGTDATGNHDTDSNYVINTDGVAPAWSAIQIDADNLIAGTDNFSVLANFNTDGSGDITVSIFNSAGQSVALSTDVYNFAAGELTGAEFEYNNHGISFSIDLNGIDLGAPTAGTDRLNSLAFGVSAGGATPTTAGAITVQQNVVNITGTAGTRTLAFTLKDTNGADKNVSLTFDAGHHTLTEVRDAINAEYTGIASLNTAGDNIILTSKFAGASTINVTNDIVGLFNGAEAIKRDGASESVDLTFTNGTDTFTETIAPSAKNVRFVDSDGNKVEFTLKGFDSLSGLNVGQAFSASDFTRDISGIDISSHEKANLAITQINDAIEAVSAERSKLGAIQNRLEYTISNLDTSAENLQASESRIRDVDMAAEMMEFTKQNILQQAAQAMLAQANQAPQGVLQLLR